MKLNKLIVRGLRGLTIYRRHRKGCKHRAKGRKHRYCQCPIWVDGFLSGKELCESLKVRDWKRALEIVREWEVEDRRAPRPVRKSLSDCWREFLIDVEARKLHHSTIRNTNYYNARWKSMQSRMVCVALTSLGCLVLVRLGQHGRTVRGQAQKS